MQVDSIALRKKDFLEQYAIETLLGVEVCEREWCVCMRLYKDVYERTRVLMCLSGTNFLIQMS